MLPFSGLHELTGLAKQNGARQSGIVIDVAAPNKATYLELGHLFGRERRQITFNLVLEAFCRVGWPESRAYRTRTICTIIIPLDLGELFPRAITSARWCYSGSPNVFKHTHTLCLVTTSQNVCTNDETGRCLVRFCGPAGPIRKRLFLPNLATE